MTLLLILGLIMLGAAVALIVRGTLGVSARTSETIHQISAYGFVTSNAAGESASARRPLDDLATTLGDFAGRRLSTLKEADYRKRLVAAGMYSMTARRLVGYQLLAGIGFGALWLWLGSVLNVNFLLFFLGVLFFAAVGWLGPLALVDGRARRRLEEVDYRLPELVDLLVVTIEAGVGFAGSLRIAAQRLKGPLGQELRLTLQEQNMGLSSTEALKHLSDRCQSPGVRSFVRSVIQGETLGVSIGQIMRNQALEMRKRRKAAAEERAQKAPVKMLFPLIFLIFPAIFVVLLVPAVIQIFDALG